MFELFKLASIGGEDVVFPGVDERERENMKSFEVHQVLRMKGGVGDESYAKNSGSQNAFQSMSRPLLEQAVVSFCDEALPEGVVAIADLGCSSGPNALFAVSEITTIFHKKCCQLGRSPPEFMVFLNDLPGNDFNTVFRSLPTLRDKLQKENGEKFGQCFIAGVPGSFHGRLFPSKSLHFVHSSLSLHWLSQIPPDLNDRENGLINKGKIFISETSPPAVIQAYSAQFWKDFSLFLKSRSEEVVAGGRMVFTLKARTTSDPTPDETCLLWDYLGQAFIDLVAEGLMEEEKLDAYNVPFYEPYVEDIRGEIEREGSFSLHRLETVVMPWNAVDGGGKYDRAATAQRMAMAIRAVNESMLESHFGPQIMDPLFRRFIQIMAADTKESQSVIVIVSLIRKD